MHLLPIKGYEGLYEVSSTGIVFACEKYITRKAWNSERTHQIYRERRQLIPKKRGLYLAQLLYDSEGNKKFHSIHRLVATAFIPNPGQYPDVNHKDEDKHNNNEDNLEWCNDSYNQSYSKSVKRMLLSPTGEVVEVFNMNEFCRNNGLNRGSINRMLVGKQQTTHGWRFICTSF